MAFVYKDADRIGKSARHVPRLARGSFDAQWDILRLARAGDRECQYWWDEFAAEAPASARMVITHDDAEREKDSEAAGKIAALIGKAHEQGGPVMPGWLAEMADSPDPGQRERARAEIERRNAHG